jgi:hypothetical protein
MLGKASMSAKALGRRELKAQADVRRTEIEVSSYQVDIARKSS